jgi:hypothetical protein
MNPAAWIDALAASGALPLIALAALAVEVIGVFWFFGNRPQLRNSLLFNAMSGAALIMALHGALTGAGGMVIAAWLASSLAAHCADLWVRLRR